MMFFLRKYQLLLLSIVCLNSAFVSAQSYKKDSLQIKSYIRIEYRNNYVKDIKLLRVMCDYCTDIQKEAIGEEAVRRGEYESLNPKNKLKDGDKKLAIYIRIAKKDFAAIKEN
ncbi:hypothetical protein [Psychroserpens sp. SPM9]|uniref:hypothetical protein n=1 Tax=Psychroserpens sp. SPM9 TaxID=2975598 RepID=UPI0021A90A79|nr:hypothetical protein [Psychroserpens sp. SPM9]MDG5491547.1 hypothetical protein [Psychroserpens sp. SPM9]